MDILEKPKSLSLTGNMEKFVISAQEEVTLTLWCDDTDTDLLVHSYSPDSNGRISIDLKDVIAADLKFKLLNQTAAYVQTDMMHSYTAQFKEGERVTNFAFRALRAGIDRLADTPENFLKTNFLTWQPNVKGVTYYTPEYLTYYASDACSLECDCHMPDGTVKHINIADFAVDAVWTIPVGYAVISSLCGGTPSFYDVWVEDDNRNRLTYIQRYYAEDMKSQQEEWVLFENSLGGVDTFRAYGNSENSAEHTHNIAEMDEDSLEYRVDTERTHNKNTGYLDKRERLWLLDFFPSLAKYIYVGQSLRRIVVTESDVSYTSKELPSNYTFKYKYADARPYLNIPRTDRPQEVMNISVPDLGSFTIAPRLVEFPRQTLSDGALMPVQDPYSEGWGATSLAELASFVKESIEATYNGDGGSGHVHVNMSLLESLILADSYLMANGIKISAAFADKAAALADGSNPYDRFLRKDVADRALGLITMLQGLITGDFRSGLFGSGASIDAEGRAEFESIFSRSFISTPELRYNRIAVTEGEQWCTNGYGIIESVDTEAMTITLHLEENDYASVAKGDLCRGVYNNFGTSEEYQNTTTLDADNCGFPIKAGFFTSYFRVSRILEQSQGKCVFEYELRNDSTPHPCAQMKFAQYGNDIFEERQASAYMSSTGHFYFQSLEKVSTWKIDPKNVTIRFGWVDGFPVKLTDESYQTLKGYGLYAPDNIYFGNAIVQLDPKTVDSLRKDLQQYTIELSSYTDVITVDDAGNVIGGLYKLNGETKHSFRIAPAVFVRKGNDYLIEADAKDDAGEGTFKMYVTPKNCTVEVINGAVCVTAIDNVKDGVAGTKDDVNFNYDAMRKMESISVIVSVNCEGVGSITKTFSVAIKHDSVPYIKFSMSNTNTSVAWNTKSSKYIGLPYSFNVFAHKGSDALPISEVKLSEVEGAKITIDNPSTEDGYTLVTIRELSNVATSTVRATFTASVKYAGVSYESNLVHTINVYQDVNVYDLRPSVTQVVMATASDGSHTPSVNYVTCRVLCNSSEDEPYYLSKTQMESLRASVKFSKSGDNTLYDYVLSPEEGTPEGVAVTDGLTRITFYLYIGDEVYDTQDVSVMYHGKNGDNGRGISSANTYYAIGDNSETEPDDGLFINDTLSALLIHSNQSKSIWSATKVVYTDKTEALTGKYFVGLAEDLVQIIEGYGLSDSPTEEPDGWGSYPTVIPQGKYLWACDLIQWVGEVMTEANVRMIGYIGKETPVYYLVSNMTSISVDDNGHIPISGQTLDITLKKSIGGDTTDSTDYNIMSYTLKADGSRTIMGSEQGNGSPFKIALPESLTDNITGYYFEVVEGDAIIASLSVLYVKNGASAYEITMSNLNLTYNSRKGNIDGNHPVSRLEVNIQCSKGGTPLKYTNGTADDWVCSTLTENVSDPIIDGVLWSFKVSEDGYTFTYVIYCKTTNKVDVEIPFVVTAGGVQRQYKIHLQSYEDGGTPLNRGIWSSEGYIDENGEATNGYFYRYKGDTLIRDLVAYKIGGIYYYYLVKDFTGDTPVTEAPATAVTTEVPVEIVDEETGETTTSVSEEVTYQTSDKWEQMSKVKTIFSEVIYADDATIGGFHANATNLWSGGDTPDTAFVSLNGKTGEINSRGAEASVRIANGLIEVLNNVGNCNIRFGLKNGYAVLSYYDNNGNLLYDLGPNGIDASDIKASKLEKVTIYCPNHGRGFYSTQYLTSAGKWATEESEGSIAYLVVDKAYNAIWSGGFGSKPSVGDKVTCYRYTAAKINGVYQAEESYGLTQEQAKLCDGLYFTKNVINEGDSLVNYKATGIIGIEYGSSVAGVPMLMGQKYAPKYKILSVSITDGKAMTSTVVSLETNGLIENI